MVWMTVSMALLFRLSGQPDVVMGLNLTDRRRPELRHVLGFFIATLPVRVRFDGDLTFAGALSAVRDAILGAQAHQDVSLTRLVGELEPARVAGAQPLFQVVATGQVIGDVTTGWSTPRLTSREIDTGLTRFDQFLSVEQSHDRLELVVVFDADLYDREAIERQVAHLFRLAEVAANQPSCVVLDLPIDSRHQRPHRRSQATLDGAAQFAFES
jgi:non-ribosomal peptide synthetase component F